MIRPPPISTLFPYTTLFPSFVSVTEKLMDELAQCYNVLPQLDINNTIDHRPEGDEKWFLENEKTVTQFCRKLAAERHFSSPSGRWSIVLLILSWGSTLRSEG